MSEEPSLIKVLVADDHAIFRSGLRKLLAVANDSMIVGEASNGVDCAKIVTTLKPDILLLDLRLPDKDGLSVLAEIGIDSLPTRTIVLTDAGDERGVIRAMRLGARGAVLRGSASEVLLKSIRKVHGGEIWLDNCITAELLDAFKKSPESRQRWETALLSNREKGIVQLVAQGFHNREIGEKLLISEQTVKNHLHAIFDKLGISDRLELVFYVICYRWIE
jgi:DNA-binding NarL/FixJ family response regulator